MFGKLTLEAIPYHEPIIMVTIAGIILGGLAIAGLITYYGKWQYLWKEWLTSVDHKRLGIMYLILGMVMLLRGFADAVLMRGQQVIASGGGEGYLNAHHYDQIFTAHGVIMIFFVAMPLIVGLMNIAVPLQIGARDVAFPFLNSLSFWLTFSGAMLVNASLIFGEFAKTGWAAYPPLSQLSFSPDVGVDYYIWSLQISGIGTLLTGVNFLVTILRMRAPGMKMMRMPIFVWTAFCTNVLIVAAFPVLAALLVCLVIAGAFIGALNAVDLAKTVAIMFILAMTSMIISLGSSASRMTVSEDSYGVSANPGTSGIRIRLPAARTKRSAVICVPSDSMITPQPTPQ